MNLSITSRLLAKSKSSFAVNDHSSINWLQAQPGLLNSQGWSNQSRLLQLVSRTASIVIFQQKPDFALVFKVKEVPIESAPLSVAHVLESKYTSYFLR
jgi:hypothetical protein